MLVFDEAQNTWNNQKLKNAVNLSGRIQHFCGIVNRQLVLWGGTSSDEHAVYHDGATISLTDGTFHVIAADNAPPPPGQFWPTPAGATITITTASSFIAFGGKQTEKDWFLGGTEISLQGSKIHTLEPWPNVEDTPAPSAKDASTWTGEELFVWHGSHGSEQPIGGIRWMP